MKRRDFVRGLGAIPLAAFAKELGWEKGEGAANPATKVLERSAVRTESATTKQLNVVVHGMFAIMIDRKGKKGPKKISLVAPKVPMHAYKAMTFKLDPSDPQKVVVDWTFTVSAPENDSVTFNRGNDPSLQIMIGEQERLAIDVSNKNPGQPAFWTIDLPVPDDICGLRAAPANYFSPCLTGNCTSDNSVNPTYKFNGMFLEQSTPLIYVLTYNQIPANEKVVFSGNKQSVNFDDFAGRLHFFAEPNTEPDPSEDHIDDAIQQLDQLFEPPLTLFFWRDKVPGEFGVGRDASVQCAKNKTVLLCEERSLYELNQSCDGFLGKPTIGTQYSAYRNLQQELDARSVQRRGKHRTSGSVQRKRTIKERNELHSALPDSAKPPSNCMSLLCIQS